MAFKNFRDIQITASDGTATPVTFVFTYDSDLALDMPGVVVNILKDRGVLPATPQFVKGADQEMTGAFTIKPEDIFDVGVAVAADFAFLGLPSTMTSTSTEADAVDLICTDGEDTWTLPDCIIRGSYADGGEGSDSQVINYTFTCPHVYPTMS